MQAVTEAAQTNYNRWKSLQEEVFKRFAGTSRDVKDLEAAEITEDRKKAG